MRQFQQPSEELARLRYEEMLSDDRPVHLASISSKSKFVLEPSEEPMPFFDVEFVHRLSSGCLWNTSSVLIKTGIVPKAAYRNDYNIAVVPKAKMLRRSLRYIYWISVIITLPVKVALYLFEISTLSTVNSFYNYPFFNPYT